MNSLYRTIVFLGMILIVDLMGAHSFTGNTSLPDSLITDDYVYEYTFSDFKKAQLIMQQLRVKSSLPQFRLDVIEGDLYFNTGRYYQALTFYKRALESDSVQMDDKLYMEQVHRMISSYDCVHDEAKKAHYVKLLLQKARACRNLEMESVALFNMGKMIYYQEDKSRGYDLMNEAVRLMKKSDYKYKYDNLRYDYNTLLIMQQRDKQYDMALKTLELLEAVVTEDSKEATAIDGLAEKEKKTMYAQRALILSRLGRLREAKEAYRAWEAIGKVYSKDDYLIIPYLLDRGLYDKSIEMNSAREAFLIAQKDTINYHMMGVKRIFGEAYKGKKEYDKAARYFQEMAVLMDSLKMREQKSAALELATIYETHERETELQEQIRRVEVRNVWLFSVVGALFFLVVLFVRYVQHTRTIRRKNATMVKTIHELLAYKDELYEAKARIRVLLEGDTANAEALVSLKTADAESECVTKEECDLTDDFSTECGDLTAEQQIEEGRLLFEKLDNIVTREKLYLNPDLSRDKLMKLIHVNKNYFGKILQENVHMNATSYINNKRLDYSAKLLEDTPYFTIASVAESCGIPNTSTFNRLFRNKFGMTPTEFRKGLETTDNKENIEEDGLNGE